MKVNHIIVLALILFSCSKGIDLSYGENIFIAKLIKMDAKFNEGTHVVFILNKSECQPCNDSVRQLYHNYLLNGNSVSFVVPKKQSKGFEKNLPIYTFDNNELAQYGLLRTNGTVLILEKKECVLLESLDLQKLSVLKNQLDKFIF